MLGASWTRNWLFSDWIWIIERNKIFPLRTVRQPTRLSNPELSAFHEMTGIPRYPASWRKYWEAAVVRPKCSLIFYFITAKKNLGSCWRKIMFLSFDKLSKFIVTQCCFPNFDQRYEDLFCFIFAVQYLPICHVDYCRHVVIQESFAKILENYWKDMKLMWWWKE